MRKAFLIISMTILSLTGILIYINLKFSFLLIIFVPLLIMGLYDMLQSKKQYAETFHY